MTEKIVTHADLPALLDLRNEMPILGYSMGGETAQIMDRLIAAAEADAPPLPEGWVLLKTADGDRRALWNAGGLLYVRDSAVEPYQYTHVKHVRDRLTPLRPTVTEADVEKAARDLAIRQEKDGEAWALAVEAERNDYRLDVRAAFKAAGIEVTEA